MRKVAICISGHLRNIDIQNLESCIIEPLTKSGCSVDYFSSIWNRKGNNNKGTLDTRLFIEAADLAQLVTLGLKNLHIEELERNFFVRNFNSGKWKKHLQLSSETTAGDAACMWYKAKRCYESLCNYEKLYNFQYDIIVRIRPDIRYHEALSFDVIENILNSDVVYIPKWYRKWHEVSFGITDYFAIGSRKSMHEYMSTFNSVPDILRNPLYPHTGEGFLAYSLENVWVKRLNMGFSVQRLTELEKIIEKDFVDHLDFLVFATHHTLTAEHAEMCLKHLGESEDPLHFHKMYIFNTHEDELPTEKILKLVQKYNLLRFVEQVEIIPRNPAFPLTLGSDFSQVYNYILIQNQRNDRILYIKSDIMVSKTLLKELKEVNFHSFILTPPFILAKKRVTDEEIFDYTRRENYVLKDEITCNNDALADERSPYDENIKFISSTGKEDFSAHFFSIDIGENIHAITAPWGGLNFYQCRKKWLGTKHGFTVHKYHDVKSANNPNERVGIDYLLA